MKQQREIKQISSAKTGDQSRENDTLREIHDLLLMTFCVKYARHCQHERHHSACIQVGNTIQSSVKREASINANLIAVNLNLISCTLSGFSKR